MAYIGKTPTPAALTASDITDGIITSAKIADATIATSDIADSAVTKAKTSGVTSDMFRNIIINGSMDIAQRGTSSSGITSDGYYTVDRFLVENGSFGTWTQTQEADAPTGQGYYNSLKMDCTTAQGSPSSSSILCVGQSVEGFMLQPIKQGTANAESTTLSFWHKHTKTGTNIVELLDADNSNAVSGSYTQSSSDTWEKATITFPANTSGTYGNDNARSLRIRFIMGAGTDYTSGTLATTWQTSITNANRYAGQVNNADSTSNNFIITGVQYEVGTSASDFEFLPVDINLKRCQRYCHVVGYSPDGRNFSKEANVGMYYTATGFYANIFFQTPMRSTPSASVQGGSDAGRVFSNGSSKTSAAVGLDGASASNMSFAISTSSATSGHCGTFNWNGAGHYCICSAEL